MARARTRGFTLVELMVAVAIIGVLASIAIPGYEQVTARARRAEHKQYVELLVRDLTFYYRQNGKFPDGASYAPTPYFSDYPGPVREMNWSVEPWKSLARGSSGGAIERTRLRFLLYSGSVIGGAAYIYTFHDHDRDRKPVGTPAYSFTYLLPDGQGDVQRVVYYNPDGTRGDYDPTPNE